MLRLEISSTAFPKSARKLNTGEDDATGTKMQVADHKIDHDAAHPSYGLIPIIPLPAIVMTISDTE
jgi:predicted acyl esterase